MGLLSSHITKSSSQGKCVESPWSMVYTDEEHLHSFCYLIVKLFVLEAYHLGLPCTVLRYSLTSRQSLDVL